MPRARPSDRLLLAVGAGRSRLQKWVSRPRSRPFGRHGPEHAGSTTDVTGGCTASLFDLCQIFSQARRSMTKLAVTAALAGRPAPGHRLTDQLCPGLPCSLFSSSFSLFSSNGSKGIPDMVLGIVALIPAVILLAPSFLVGLGRIAGPEPVAVQIALRELARYRARSASALAAIAPGVMIAAVSATVAQAQTSPRLRPTSSPDWRTRRRNPSSAPDWSRRCERPAHK